MMWEQRVSVAMVLGELGEGRVWPGRGEEVCHSLVVNGNWEQGALSVCGVQEYPGEWEYSLSSLSVPVKLDCGQSESDPY